MHGQQFVDREDPGMGLDNVLDAGNHRAAGAFANQKALALQCQKEGGNREDASNDDGGGSVKQGIAEMDT